MASLLSMAGLIACKDASLFHTFLCSRPPPSMFYKLLEIERRCFLVENLPRVPTPTPSRAWQIAHRLVVTITQYWLKAILSDAIRTTLDKHTWHICQSLGSDRHRHCHRPPAAGHAVPAARAHPAEAPRHQSILQHCLSLCLDLQGLQSGLRSLPSSGSLLAACKAAQLALWRGWGWLPGARGGAGGVLGGSGGWA